VSLSLPSPCFGRLLALEALVGIVLAIAARFYCRRHYPGDELYGYTPEAGFVAATDMFHRRGHGGYADMNRLGQDAESATASFVQVSQQLHHSA
jgi:hypothetical protein